jgi:hypothetical protein
MEKVSIQVENGLLEASKMIKAEEYIKAAAIIAEFEEVENTCSKYRALVDSMKKKLEDERRSNATKDPEASLQAKIIAELGLTIISPATVTPPTQRPVQQPRRQQTTSSIPPVATAAPTTTTQPAAPTPPQGPVPPTQPTTSIPPVTPTPPVEPPIPTFYTPPATTTPTRSKKIIAAVKGAFKDVIG